MAEHIGISRYVLKKRAVIVPGIVRVLLNYAIRLFSGHSGLNQCEQDALAEYNATPGLQVVKHSFFVDLQAIDQID